MKDSQGVATMLGSLHWEASLHHALEIHGVGGGDSMQLWQKYHLDLAPTAMPASFMAVVVIAASINSPDWYSRYLHFTEDVFLIGENSD